MGQVWQTNSDGGFMYSDNLTSVLRTEVQPLTKFRQFCDFQDATVDKSGNPIDLHQGDTFHWNVYSDVAQQGGQLTETNTMRETNFTISQGTLTVTEYGNSIPYTGKLNDLSEHPVKTIINKTLKHDAKKAFDIAAHDQFNATKLRAAPVDGTSTDSIVLTTNGTATATNSVALSSGHVKVIVDTMKERNIPPFMGDDYMSISHPTTYRGFKNDLEAIHQYTERGLDHIFNGEMGRYEATRFIEQSHIPKGGAADSSTFRSVASDGAVTLAADAWNVGQSSWAFFFGGDTVAEAIVIEEEMRAKIPGDYGRSRGVAWYYLGGFGIVHTDADQSRIVKWDSAV